jgi:hypothetical protein
MIPNYSLAFYPAFLLAPGVGSDIKKPEGKESCYDQVPVAAAYELTMLLKVAREGLPRVSVPT